MHWHRAIGHHAALGDAYVLATVIATNGSAPRPAGTKMVITTNQEHDTLGGGQLEHLVIARAKELLSAGQTTQHIEHYPLAASALQCCGGSVTVMLECFANPQLRVAVFGAGHIGQRVVALLEQLGAQIRWIDDRSRDPNLEGDLHPAGLTTPLERTDQPATVIGELHEQTQIVIVSHDHQLDYELLLGVLNKGIEDFAGVGMIGSKTKWQRFRARLLDAGHSTTQIDQIRCPLAQGPATDKQPAAIAIAIVNELLNLAGEHEQQETDGNDNPKRSSHLSWRQIKSTLVQDASK